MELSENGLGRFSSISKSYRALKNKLVTNWDEDSKNFPLICGGMKFTVEHSEDEWQDFKDSDWFVPEFMLLKISGKHHLLYNFVNRNTSSKQIDKFSQRLENLLNIQNKVENKDVRNIIHKRLTPKDKKKWKSLVSEALEKLTDHEISKIVLSRRVDMVLSAEPNWDEIRKYFADQLFELFNFYLS